MNNVKQCEKNRKQCETGRKKPNRKQCSVKLCEIVLRQSQTQSFLLPSRCQKHFVATTTIVVYLWKKYFSDLETDSKVIYQVKLWLKKPLSVQNFTVVNISHFFISSSTIQWTRETENNKRVLKHNFINGVFRWN